MTLEQPILNLVSIDKFYDSNDVKYKFQALKNISLSIQPGEVVILIGPSGSGKSTLFNIICGLEKPTKGSIQFKGTNLYHISDTERTKIRKDEIGIIFQFFELHQGLTSIETIELALIIGDKFRNSVEKRANDIISDMNLENKKKRLIRQLSRGEKQRVAIGRALANDPSLIVADEPTGSLDPVIGMEILELLRNCVKKHKKTLLLATHDYNLLQDGDRIIQLENGMIVEDLKDTNRGEYFKNKSLIE
ncbi:MAG: ABC transporter ATP-binding protein [Promethearchaeota archaeon]